jgi:2-polyprenyl-3-methyl-5-hydroxy-6-metoxy-1,4-benzoquinol methylase
MSAATPEPIMKLGLGFWASKTLLSAVELGLFTLLAEAPADLSTVQGRLGLHRRSARDFLDALVALQLLERRDGVYANSAATDHFLDRNKPTYIGGILEMANARLYGFWGSLTQALRTGEPQNESRSGEDFFAKIYADPQRLRGFLSAMSGLSQGAAHAIARKFAWSRYKTFTDIGTAQGMLAVTLAQSHAQLTGIGFDLPAVEPVFEAFVAANGLADRVRFQAGNFFEDKLPQVDVIIMGHILHDWDLPQKAMLVAKAYEALPKDGALIVYDAMIDDERRENAFGLLMSLNMLIETPGGFDYTGADCLDWLRAAGFSKTRIEPLVGPDCMAIGYK